MHEIRGPQDPKTWRLPKQSQSQARHADSSCRAPKPETRNPGISSGRSRHSTVCRARSAASTPGDTTIAGHMRILCVSQLPTPPPHREQSLWTCLCYLTFKFRKVRQSKPRTRGEEFCAKQIFYNFRWAALPFGGIVRAWMYEYRHWRSVVRGGSDCGSALSPSVQSNIATSPPNPCKRDDATMNATSSNLIMSLIFRGVDAPSTTRCLHAHPPPPEAESAPRETTPMRLWRARSCSYDIASTSRSSSCSAAEGGWMGGRKEFGGGV